MKLQWSAFAIADREEIFDYIAADSPRAAVSMDERIERRVQALAVLPKTGRAGRVEGTRELVIGGTPYIIAYRIAGDELVILRVLHGARLWPQGM